MCLHKPVMMGFVNITRMVFADSNACWKPIPASGGNFFDLLDTDGVKEDQMGTLVKKTQFASSWDFRTMISLVKITSRMQNE